MAWEEGIGEESLLKREDNSVGIFGVGVGGGGGGSCGGGPRGFLDERTLVDSCLRPFLRVKTVWKDLLSEGESVFCLLCEEPPECSGILCHTNVTTVAFALDKISLHFLPTQASEPI